MKSLDFKLSESKTIYFYGKSLWKGKDNLIDINTDKNHIDYLIFMDSRGFCGPLKSSLVGRIIVELKNRNKSYLIIIRPLELTIWATLNNFYILNNFKFSNLITNMGFVDFTPKKKSICEDSLKQITKAVGYGEANAKSVEFTKNKDNQDLELFIIEYSEKYKLMAEKIIKKQRTIILNTPEVNKNISIERVRPNSFFESLSLSNTFNRNLSNATIIEPGTFNKSHTYDAVHYSPLGSKKIFAQLQEVL